MNTCKRRSNKRSIPNMGVLYIVSLPTGTGLAVFMTLYLGGKKKKSFVDKNPPSVVSADLSTILCSNLRVTLAIIAALIAGSSARKSGTLSASVI